MNTKHSISIRSGLFAVVTAALLVGCSSVKLDDAPPVETRTPTTVGAGTAGSSTSGAGQSGVTTVDLTKGAGTTGLTRVIYFDFDSYAVKDEYRGTIDTYAKALTADRKKHLVV